MSWICPKGCHKLDDDNHEFCVKRAEDRTDTIVHFYSAEDGNLENSLSFKVYPGNDSKLGPVECSICESPVMWKSEIGGKS